jgi:hypothetical protein
MKLSGIHAAFLAAAMSLSAGGAAEASGDLGLDALTLATVPQVGPTCCVSAGWLFTANTDATVIGLGTYWGGPDAFPHDQQVGLSDVSGSSPVLLASTFVTGSETPVGEAPWVFESIAPVTLNAGDDYIVASQGGADLGVAIPLIMNPALDYEFTMYSILGTNANSPLQIPTIPYIAEVTYFGGNVLLAPEPSTWVMMFVGFAAGLGFAGYRRVKAKAAFARA